MQNELVENLTTAGKASFEALQELGEINSKTFQKLTDIQVSIATLGFESGVEQFNLLSSTENYSELLSAESDLASEFSEKVMEYTQQAADVLTESRMEMSDWFKASMPFLPEEMFISDAVVETKPAPKKKAKKRAKRVAKKA